jgi:serine/threonine-protein kinase
MELQNTTKIRVETNEPAREQHVPESSASFCVRLWAYGGPGKPMSAVPFDSDPEVQELIRGLVTSGQGRIDEQLPEALLACFHHPLYALSAAKTLQQRLLTFHRPQPPQQVVASILISRWKGSGVSAAHHSPAEPASQMTSAQILVSEQIYELARHEPGFQFNPKPVREPGEGSFSEAMYELLWTDESTYGHLREAGQSTGIQTADRYQIQGELGRGAMGVVYQAYDQLIGRTVALKTISIDRNAPNRRELIERLKREAKAAGGLDHPNIITIYDVGQEDDRVYLSMQFVEGKTLQALLAEGRLPPLPTLISYAEQILSAVGFAHARGVIHRDLKPANLMLTSQGIIKVLDFGIAKIEDATLTQTGLVVGTPTHMAPEQAADRKIDQRTDIFALGSVFYELFTLEKPFKGDVPTVLYKIMHEDPLPPSIINPALPGGIDAIIRKALAKDPKDRFQSCEEMAKAFEEQAALLKTPSSSISTGTILAVAPARRPTAPTPNYLLETTTVRPLRRIWPNFLIGVLLAAIGAGGYVAYVKFRTGTFPPLLEKLAAAWQRALPQSGSGSPNSGAGFRRPDENAPVQARPVDPLNVKTDDPSVDNAGAISGAQPATTPASQDSAGASDASQSSASAQEAKGQPSAENGVAPTAILPPVGETGQKLPESAGSTNTPLQSAGASERSGQNQNGQEVTRPMDASSSSAGTSARSPGAQDESAEPARKKIARSASAGAGPIVEGFSRRDVPELLRQADAAAGRGDYRMARYEYNLILKIDRNNAAARTGLRHMQAAELDRFPH